MRMATLLHLPPPFSPFSRNNDYNNFNIIKTKLFFLNNNNNNTHSNSNKTEYRPCRCPISASSTNKSSRVPKKAVRSNEEICNEIRAFLSDFNLPHDHFPSFKLLSDNGRQDLANIVRRRGYKLLKELLSTSVETNTTENGSTEEQDNVIQHESTGQVKELPGVIDLSNEAPIINDDSSIINSDSEFKLGESKCISSVSSLQEKVAIFIQRGELNMMKNSFDIINEDVSKEDGGFFESENSTIIFSNSAMEDQNILSRPGSGGDVLLSQQVLPNGTSRNNYVYTDGLSSSDSNNDLDVEARKKDNEVEISRLRFMLHRKELELSDLKKQIEKEKIALSVLQAKAEAEISNAQKLVSDKDAELLAAEESLSELEEVQIQFWDDGESVELAGSFNGWQQRIKMEPQPASSVMDSDSIQSRKPRLWRTVLWLYPGIYEIKFIVDGHWKIDTERESVTKGTIHNNILRINR